MSEPETITDIITKKRRSADEIERDVEAKMRSGEMESAQFARELVCGIRKEADGLESALVAERSKWAKANGELAMLLDPEKIPPINAAKLRVLMDVILGIVSNMSAKIRSGESVDVLNNTTKNRVLCARSPLSAPPRNCDRFKTKEEAAIAFANEKKQWIPQQVLWELAPWLDWLFAQENESEVK